MAHQKHRKGTHSKSLWNPYVSMCPRTEGVAQLAQDSRCKFEFVYRKLAVRHF
jgi:hypothetical protein